MKIGIDISQTAFKGTGVARYTTSLLKGLMLYDTQNEYTLFFSSLRQPVPKEITKLLSERVKLKKFGIPPAVLNIIWNKVHTLPIENFIGNVDVFLSSDWTEPPARKAKKITTIHDLVPYKFPETSQHKTRFSVKNLNLSPNIVEVQKKRLKWVKKESAVITANSKATRDDIIEILGIEKERIQVIYPGVEISADAEYQAVFKKKYKLEKPFIFTVGTLQPRKNIERLIHAFSQTQLSDIDLYIAGMQGWGNSIKNKSQNIKLLGYVSDEDLPYLYKNCLFFIYPALYEGFGYPVIEAMKMGAAVATSSTSSLKEVADKTALLFDPHSEESIASAIHKLYSDEKLRKELQKKSLVRAEDFSIKQFAEGFISIFNDLK
jgi:glycosyltransferase involved in cell wall biosynthesis